MTHFIDTENGWDAAMNGLYIGYVKELKERGRIRCIAMGTHNPVMAKIAVGSGCSTPGVPPSVRPSPLCSASITVVLARAPKHTFGQRECAYCGHCKPCLANTLSPLATPWIPPRVIRYQ